MTDRALIPSYKVERLLEGIEDTISPSVWLQDEPTALNCISVHQVGKLRVFTESRFTGSHSVKYGQNAIICDFAARQPIAAVVHEAFGVVGHSQHVAFLLLVLFAEPFELRLASFLWIANGIQPVAQTSLLLAILSYDSPPPLTLYAASFARFSSCCLSYLRESDRRYSYPP